MKQKKLHILLPLFLLLLLLSGCGAALPEDAPAYSEDAVYTFLEESVLRGAETARGYFALNGAGRQETQDALDAVMEQALSQDGILSYALSQYSWSTEAAGRDGIFVEVDFTYEEDLLPLAELQEVSSPEETFRAVMQGLSAASDQSASEEPFCTLLLSNHSGLWGADGIGDSLLPAIDNADLPITPKCSYLLLPSEDAQRQLMVLEFSTHLSAEEYGRCKAEMDDALDALAQQIRSSAGADADAETLYRAAHDAILSAAEYDTELADLVLRAEAREDLDPNYSAYGAVVTGKTVCYGYATAYKLLCDRLELPCWAVGGTADGGDGEYIPHQWNLVHLDGSDYLIDCTWDDTPGIRPYTYFMTDPAPASHRAEQLWVYGW